ncbi:hypothetical protein [Nonomuraea candida]|uniref:hypothetical protein n=1 Tax=Nonomuraea candida TaxID=359159 RepID=UPI0005BBC803|nr:hypothetical protein [Nonomuraea candida]
MLLRLLLPSLLLISFLTTPAQAAVALPGGKANYVVALGSLAAGSHDNWVRLGTYQFSPDGTVRARTYLWWQRHPAARQSTGTTPGNTCTTTDPKAGQTKARRCAVQTAGGFLGAPQESRTGSFSVSGDQVHITWDVSQAWSERWRIAVAPGGGLSRLDLTFNTLARYGYAYGSNAALTRRRAMSTLAETAITLKHDYTSWSAAGVKPSPASGGTFDLGEYRTCDATTWCLARLQPSSPNACQKDGGCPHTGGPDGDTSIQHHIQQVSSGDRRDTWWHWCTCLARDQGVKAGTGPDSVLCYSGNSHVKPMLQIIDDTGAFRGWVGVEASFSPSGGRTDDMLAVFRATDYRPTS